MEFHKYDDPSYLANVFEKQRENMTPEERKKDNEDFQAFVDWMLMEEDNEE